jgi:hypothetical protein
LLRYSLNHGPVVEKLLFPVKRSHVIARSAWLFWLGVTATGCGYAPAYGGERPEQRLTVVGSSPGIPQTDVVHEVLAGARQELSRAGVLQPGTRHPRLMIQVLRVDEESSGIVAPNDLPLARGSSVGVSARAWVESQPGAEPSRDSGDLRRVEWVSAGPTSVDDALRYDGALRVAGRRLGQALARRVLGEPEPAIEPM